METIERIRTEKAFEFLVDRNPLDDRTDRITQVQYVTLLATFHHTHGDEAIEGLAGFFCYAIDNMSEEEQTRAIRNVFAHDLSGAEDKLMCPRSLGYAEVWHKEFDEKYPYTESRKLNELQAQPDSGKYEFTNPVKVDTQQDSANKMREYRVSWEIDVEASTPEEAAWKAAEIQKKPFIDSYAHVFTVTDEEGEQHNVDLDEIHDNKKLAN